MLNFRIIEDSICFYTLVNNASVHKLLCLCLGEPVLFIARLALTRHLKLVIQPTVQYPSRTARYPTKIDTRSAPFMRTVALFRKVDMMSLDELVAGAPLRRHEALVVDEELVDPRADRDHVDEDQDEGDPLGPGVQELLFTIVCLATLT